MVSGDVLTAAPVEVELTCFIFAAITHCRRAQSFQNADIPNLGRNQQRYHSGIMISARRLAMRISLTTASQVDDAADDIFTSVKRFCEATLRSHPSVV
jgi:hypothetical protein